MGLRVRGVPVVVFAALFFATVLNAAPRLRLVSTTVGPLSIASGASGPSQTLEAYNAGDGSLALSLSASVPWINAFTGPARPCSSRIGSCIPLQLTLNTSTLTAGAYTGIVTVSDPNAVDAPQTITVTVQIGGAVPAGVDLFVAPGGQRDVPFVTNSQVTSSVKTTDGGQWLSLALDGNGSFRFNYPYRIHLAPPSSMPLGTYSGSVILSGSSFAPDNKTIPVTMRLTSQPIAVPSVDRFRARLAQGAPPLSSAIALNNVGQSNLVVQSATATGGPWLTATSIPGGAALTLDPTTLSPGVSSGSVTITSNAVNGSVTVPVDFEVVAKSAPLINYQGVQDNAIFVAGDTVAAGDVLVVKGEQLSFSPLTVGAPPPLDTTVGGAKVLVNGQPAPMYYSSYGQLAFQLPFETPLSTALVQVQRDGVPSNTVSVNVGARAPRLLRVNVGDYGAIVNATDGSLPMPVGSFPGVNTRPAMPGETLTIYAIGLGATSPAVASGQPAPSDNLPNLVTKPVVNFGGGIGAILATPLYAGLSPTYAGLYQVNVTIPPDVPKGTVEVVLVFPDTVSNGVQIAIH